MELTGQPRDLHLRIPGTLRPGNPGALRSQRHSSKICVPLGGIRFHTDPATASRTAPQLGIDALYNRRNRKLLAAGQKCPLRAGRAQFARSDRVELPDQPTPSILQPCAHGRSPALFL